METKTILVFTDGGARGNPGPAAIGVYIQNNKKEVLGEISKKIGISTNNIAEYQAVLEAFFWILENTNLLKDVEKIEFFLDSQLVYSQLIGVYKIKNAKLREILFKIREKEALVKTPILYNHISRIYNKEADRLVNQALDI